MYPRAPAASAAKTLSSSSTMDTTSTAVAGATAEHPAGRLDAGGAGQVDVHEHDVRCVVLECRKGFLGGAGSAGDLDLGQCREQPGQAVTEDGVVIDDQDPGHAGTAGAPGTCAGAVSTGSRACHYDAG